MMSRSDENATRKNEMKKRCSPQELYLRTHAHLAIDTPDAIRRSAAAYTAIAFSIE
jgi:hypothetical protein